MKPQAAKLSADGANAKVDVSFGTPGAGTGSPTAGKLNVTTTGAGGDAGGIFVTSGENLVVGTLDTANATSQNIAIATTGGANLTLAGGGAAYALDTDAVTLTPSGAFTLSENLNLGSLSVSGGTAITISNPIVTADVTTGSSGGITLSGSGAVALNAALTTGSTTVADTAGDQSVSSGSISVTSSSL